MDGPRVLITRRWPEPVEQALAARFDFVPPRSDAALTPAQLRSALCEADAVCPTVTDRISADILSVKGRRARILANFGVGHNHIDLAAARAAGVAVTNTPDVLTASTADLTIALMLMVARRLGEGERHVRAGLWSGWRPTHMLGSDITRKTLGLVGFGRIARAVAQRARAAFDMRVLAFTPRPPSASTLAESGVEICASLDELLPQADFLSLHCPGGADTRHLIDSRRISLMKPAAFLINTARGEVVEQAALLAALQTGVLAGAAIDVYENEPRVPATLKNLENVVLLPHLGSATLDTRIAMGMRAIENLAAFFDGREPPDRVA